MRVLFLLLAIAVLIGAWITLSGNGEDAVPHRTMQIISSAFAENQAIPAKYTCEGENVNPPLEIRGVPSDAKSVALIVDDPDAPVKTWVHWVLWNITPPDAIEGKTVTVPENGLPRGAVEGRTSFNEPGYGGPCPPSGEHRYFFKAYALDTTLNLDPTADKRALTDAMRDHIVDSAELVGRYRRN
jgi:Raf kinase inhibitor-like YbhB/YbcL family protein